MLPDILNLFGRQKVADAHVCCHLITANLCLAFLLLPIPQSFPRLWRPISLLSWWRVPAHRASRHHTAIQEEIPSSTRNVERKGEQYNVQRSPTCSVATRRPFGSVVTRVSGVLSRASLYATTDWSMQKEPPSKISGQGRERINMKERGPRGEKEALIGRRTRARLALWAVEGRATRSSNMSWGVAAQAPQVET